MNLRRRLARSGLRRTGSRDPVRTGPTRGTRWAAIIGASATAGNLPAPIVHRLAGAGATLGWALRPAKRRQLADNLCHALGLPSTRRAISELVRREVRNEAARSADFLWALAHQGELRRAAVERLRTRAGLGIRYDFEPVSKVAPLLRDGEAILVLGDDAEEGTR